MTAVRSCRPPKECFLSSTRAYRESEKLMLRQEPSSLALKLKAIFNRLLVLSKCMTLTALEG